MKKALLMFLFLVFVSSMSFANTNYRDPLKIAEESSVKIFSIGMQGFTNCSGVLLKNDKEKTVVLTAKHCISLSEELYVESILAKKVGVHVSDDLAYIILNSPVKNKVPVKISTFSANINDTVYMVGYPNKLFTGSGKVYLNSADWQWAEFRSIPGCSGGGIFNDKGELVGILWGTIRGKNVSIFEKLNEIKAFIAENELIK